MRSVEALPADVARSLVGLVFDLDGTLLTEGALTLEAYRALFALRDAGLALVACTGRPAAWGQVVQRQWPVDLTVTENGAVVFVRDGGGVRRIERTSPEERVRRRRRLDEIAAAMRAAFPDAEPADDNLGRVSDVTFDIGEARRVPAGRVAEMERAAARLGARTFTSSVHLHVTLDGDDKATGTLYALGRTRGEDATAALARWGFVGDSANDAPCFAAFHHTFGVANVRAELARLTVAPRWSSARPCGSGFAEIAGRLCALRGARDPS
jgi:HAD superfamily hydrolase (TIGR01484 family)